MVLEKKRIVILASGSGSNLQIILDNIKEKKINGSVVAVISNRKGAYALERAKNAGLKDIYIGKGNYKEQSNRERALFETLQQLEPDLIVLAGYLEIIPSNIIKRYNNKIMNIHPALIPSFSGGGYYGMNVHRAVVEYGVKLTGATVHFVDAGTDTGPVIMQESVSVTAEDSAEEVQKKVLKIEHKLLPKAVALFCEDKIRVNGRIVEIGGN